MTDNAFLRIDPIQSVEQLGFGIVNGKWTSDEATRKAAGTLMDLLCDSRTINEDFIAITEAADTAAMTPDHPLFVPLVQTTTRGIFLREDSDEEPELPTNITIQELVSNSTEGILWESAEGNAFRERYTAKSGTLLRGFARGMAKAGLSKHRGKSIMRTEIMEMLDDVGTRIPSYAAINFVLVGSTIVHRAGLATPKTVAKDFTRMAKGFLR